MGRYYDDDYISHSSGPWKKHKYIKKVGSGASAVYYYAKNKAENTAKNAARDAKYKVGVTQRRWYKQSQKDLKKAKNEYEKARKEGSVNKDGSYDPAHRKIVRSQNEVRNQKKRVNYTKNLYNKTPLGKAENTVNSTKRKVRKASNSVDKFLNSTSKEFKKRLKNSKGRTNLKGAKKLGNHLYVQYDEPKVAPKGKTTGKNQDKGKVTYNKNGYKRTEYSDGSYTVSYDEKKDPNYKDRRKQKGMRITQSKTVHHVKKL